MCLLIVDEPVRARHIKPSKLIDPGAPSLRLAIEQADSSNRKNGSDKGKSGSGKGFDFHVKPVEVKLYPGLGCNGPGVLKTGKGCPNSLLTGAYKTIAPKWDGSLIQLKGFAKEDCNP